MRYLIGLAAILTLATPSAAAQFRCDNPGGAYLAVVRQAEVILDPDTFNARLPIIGRIDTREIGAIVLQTADPTVTEIFHTRPEPKMEVFSDGELAQVDFCVEL